MTATTTSPARDGLGPAVVKTLNTAITTAMKEIGDRHDCRPMHWYLSEVNGFDRGDVMGFPGPNDGDAAERVQFAEQWASVLGLVEWAIETPGYRSWLGLVGTSRIEIWCKASDTAGAA